MIISTKCQYALRAVYEIARLTNGQIMTIGDIAQAQRIPQRYLEGILNQLRKGGILEAQRGRSGGYRLAKAAEVLSVGEVVRLIDGPIRATVSAEEARTSESPRWENYVFQPTWQKVQQTIDQTLDATFFSQLLRIESEAKLKGVPSYVI